MHSCRQAKHAVRQEGEHAGRYVGKHADRETDR